MAQTPAKPLTPSPLPQQVAHNVAQAIERNGTSIVWLCSETGIARVTMHRRLAGQSPFNLGEIDRIATALRVPASDLLRETAA